MASTHAKLSVTVPVSVLAYIGAAMGKTGKSKSAVVSEALRAHFEPSERPQWGIAAGPTQEDFDALEARVREIEQAAERAGAL